MFSKMHVQYKAVAASKVSTTKYHKPASSENAQVECLPCVITRLPGSSVVLGVASWVMGPSMCTVREPDRTASHTHMPGPLHTLCMTWLMPRQQLKVIYKLAVYRVSSTYKPGNDICSQMHDQQKLKSKVGMQLESLPCGVAQVNKHAFILFSMQ